MYVERGNSVNNMYLERNIYRGDRYVVSLKPKIYSINISGSVSLCGIHLSLHEI